jgi:uncharacterized membrane protein
VFALPTIPSWDALHPGVSHFPIVLLIVAPVFLLIGLLSPRRRDGYLTLALVLMAVGTLGVFLSAASGDAARDAASKTPPIATAIAEHEELGSVVRAAFSALTCLFAAILYGPRLLKRSLAPAAFTALLYVLLVVSFIAFLPLYHAAHSGGLLVHKLGVHAKL